MPSDVQELARAVAVLRSGGLVAFPTETVYGLGADAENVAAVRDVFRVKGRPTGHPLIVHLADAHALTTWGRELPAVAFQLAEAFWPGPLTLIVRRAARVLDAVTGGADTVGLRVPAHPLALELLRELAGAIAAPSANRFGAVSPTSAEHVRADLGKDVDFVLDGGPCRIGVESTIVDVTRGPVRVLRPGGVTIEQLTDVVGGPVAAVTHADVRAPGMLDSHYAPRARVIVTSGDALQQQVADARGSGKRVGVIVATERSEEALAHSLYAELRRLDAQGCEVIYVTLPSQTGLGLAVADRLRKAAGPRPA